MKLYSIMPIFPEHIDEICEDVISHYENGIATEALFKVVLTPEGDPVIDKAAIMVADFRKFKKKQRLPALRLNST